jgi:large subunit ribosomal protein L6
MSRTGKQPISVPEKVKIAINAGKFFAEGPLGKEEVAINSMVKLVVDGNVIRVEPASETANAGAIHGMMRALIANAVNGVAVGFTKELEINGVGYRAEVKGSSLNLTLGFSHPVEYLIPKGIKIAVDKQTRIAVTGSSKDLVGRVSADIRSYRPPEPYKGKGIKYVTETIIRKVGKAAGGK